MYAFRGALKRGRFCSCSASVVVAEVDGAVGWFGARNEPICPKMLGRYFLCAAEIMSRPVTKMSPLTAPTMTAMMSAAMVRAAGFPRILWIAVTAIASVVPTVFQGTRM